MHSIALAGCGAGSWFVTTHQYNSDIGDKLHPPSTVVQFRWYWSQLEPQEGRIRFGMIDSVLARCREGVNFSESAPRVRAVFVLAGTRDERNFYLYALSAIAQVAGDPEFMERWTSARGTEGLRDVVLLGRRTRTE